jgi:diphthine-ammonia ligase
VQSAAVLFSGGKDSTYAISELRKRGYVVACLITLVSENADSYMLHTANIRWAELAAQALELPLVLGKTKGEKELELQDIEDAVDRAKKKFDFQMLASGGIASEYQKSRLAQIARATKLTSVNPLWGIDQKEYLLRIVRDGFRFILTSVSTYGLDEQWLGREINSGSAEELVRLSEKFHFNASLEGGEGETLVLDCPLYRRNRIEIVSSYKTWDGFRGKLEIQKVELIPKLSK